MRQDSTRIRIHIAREHDFIEKKSDEQIAFYHTANYEPSFVSCSKQIAEVQCCARKPTGIDSTGPFRLQKESH